MLGALQHSSRSARSSSQTAEVKRIFLNRDLLGRKRYFEDPASLTSCAPFNPLNAPPGEAA